MKGRGMEGEGGDIFNTKNSSRLTQQINAAGKLESIGVLEKFKAIFFLH